MAQPHMLLQVALQFALLAAYRALELRFLTALEGDVPPQTLLAAVHAAAVVTLELRQSLFPRRRPQLYPEIWNRQGVCETT